MHAGGQEVCGKSVPLLQFCSESKPALKIFFIFFQLKKKNQVVSYIPLKKESFVFQHCNLKNLPSEKF